MKGKLLSKSNSEHESPALYSISDNNNINYLCNVFGDTAMKRYFPTKATMLTPAQSTHVFQHQLCLSICIYGILMNLKYMIVELKYHTHTHQDSKYRLNK